MNDPIKFIKFFVIGAGIVGSVFIPYYFFSLSIGEINIEKVIDIQLNHKDKKNIFFRSGLNQAAFSYKTKLMLRQKPKIVVLGSSRSTQIREQFFNKKFVNLGGAIQGVRDIEQYSIFLNTNAINTDLTILIIDPWWFNNKTLENDLQQPEYPNGVSINHLIKSMKLLENGNWIKKSFQNDHLGIAAILTNEGYGSDGSNNYTKYVSKYGKKTDLGFQDTIYRISEGKYPFQTSDHPSSSLITRACSAIGNIEKNTENLIILAPPFAPSVWDALINSPQMSYFKRAFEQLENCLDKNVHDYQFMQEADDCEFLDGFHAGDTLAARLIRDLYINKEINANSVNIDFINEFIERESGFASGFTRHQFKDFPEVDFLDIGCSKL